VLEGVPGQLARSGDELGLIHETEPLGDGPLACLLPDAYDVFRRVDLKD
jgi:hypothetical protein